MEKISCLNFSKIFTLFAAFACVALPLTNADNILCLMITPTIGSQMWSDALFRALAAQGHHLTVVSAAPPGNYDSPNVEYIFLERVADVIQKTTSRTEVMPDASLSPYKQMMWYKEWHLQACRGALESEGFKRIVEILKNRQRSFKLILYEATYGKSCLLSLAHMLPDAPIAGVSAFKVTPELMSAVRGTHTQPATVPYFTTDFTGVMNYWQRLQNTGVYVLAAFFREFVVNTVLEGMVDRNEPLEEAMAVHDLALTHRIKFVLVNSHQSVDHLQSLPANIIEVGGLHIPKTPTALSDDIQNFINEFPSGIILVSLGVDVSTKVWSDEQDKTVMAVAKKFPEYGFLWRVGTRGKKVTQLPNVYLAESLPQNDILAHPGIKAFLTHASHLNLQEAVYHGVPIIAVPLQFDEFNNAARVEDLNFGIRVDWKDLNVDHLYNALFNLTNTLQYAVYARGMKMIFGLRPQPPLQTAVWWVEQLLQHPASCDHLISDVDFVFVVQRSWDVIVLVQFFAAMLVLNIYLVINQFCSNRKETKIVQKKKKKKN